jgi:hypothetical protein
MKEYGTLGGIVKDRPEDLERYREGLDVPENDPSERIYIEPEAEPLPEHDPIKYARETVNNAIAGSDYFIELAHEKDIDLGDKSSTKYLRLLYDVTNEYLDQESNRQFFMEIDGGETYHAIRLLGTAPYVIRQETALDKAKVHGYKDSVGHAKSAATAFNSTLFDLVKANPKRSLTELAEQVELTTTSFDYTAQGYAYNVMLQIERGIRTEYAVWQAYNYKPVPGHSIRRGSTDEDKHGIDFIIGLPDGVELKTDIKSGLQQVIDLTYHHEPTRAEPYTKTENGQFVYCPLTIDESFMKGTFELDLGEKIKLRNRMLEHFQKMANL